MEKGGFFPAEMNCVPSDHHLPQLCSLNLNWDLPPEQNSRFGSALSSIVSSPSHPSVAASGGSENVVIRELIGRLGSICNSGEISPQPYQYQNGGIDSAAASCYSTPLGSPSKLNLSATYGNAPASGSHLVQMEPQLAERMARLSSFCGGYSGQFVLPEAASGLSRSKSLVGGGLQMEVNMRPNFGSGLSNSSTPDNGEDSSVSNHTMASTDVGSPRGAGESGRRKRKAAQRGKPKDSTLSSTTKELPKVEAEDVNAKRTKSSENNLGAGKDEVKPKVESSNGCDSAAGEQKPGKENNPKPPEPPKQDYIHVRARRGQATDSHSLAERVRREKISERMKFLQDLVPGCNKVTGKAVMLDEIINYVQSLQRQVEFLSMKLATVNPRLDFNMEALLQKDNHQTHGLLPLGSLPVEMPGPVFPLSQQPSQGSLFHSVFTSGMESHCTVNPLDASFRASFSLQLPRLDGFVDGSSQIGNYWDEDLQHVVQMGFVQNQEAAFSSQTFHGVCPTSHMKVEL